MANERAFDVYGDNGLRGTVFAASRFLDDSPERRILLSDGREFTVPASSLEAQPDGSFYLKSLPQEPSPPAPVSEPPAPPPAALPPETPPIMGAGMESAEPLLRDDYEIKRVVVRKLIDQPAQSRQEGDTLIIPLMEEVLVLEKRLMLREELHVIRHQQQIPKADFKPLRREELEKG